MAGALAVRCRQDTRLRDRKVVLVDYVMIMITGATVEGCARTLLRSAAAAVDELTLARVVRGAH